MVKTYIINVTCLEDDLIFQNMINLVSEERKEKVFKYRFQKDRNLSLGAGLVLDAGLRNYGLCEKQMELISTENGKPAIKGYSQIHFNISHSGVYAVASFSDYFVGIDIQKQEEISNKSFNNLKIAKQFFTTDEYDYLTSFPSQEIMNNEFYRLWTLKESFIKYIGLGLKIPLDSFHINVDKTSNGVSVIQNIIKENLYFKEYIIDNYNLAICSFENSFNEIDFIVL